MTGYFAVSKRVKDIFESNNISNCEFIPMNCTEWRERDGSDIFVFDNKDNTPIITEKLRKILTKGKLTNVEFVKVPSITK